MASPPGPVMEFLGRVAYDLETMRPLLPTYLHLLVSAIFPIYTAAHASLSRPPSAAPRKTKTPTGDDEERDEDEARQIESLTPSDALLFPLLAGGTLASLYFILKWLQDPAWLNWALGIYFSQIGLFFAVKFLKDMFRVARSLCFPSTYSSGGSVWKVDGQQRCYRSEDGKTSTSPFPAFLRVIPIPRSVSRRIWTLRNVLYAEARLRLHVHGLITLKESIDVLAVASLVLSCVVVYYHGFVSKPWFLTNFLGFSFCYGSLQYMTPTTAWTGTLVLSALFFYDIYFVFFTPMMVTVATKLDVPIKLLFPRPDGCVFPVGAPEGSAAMEEYLQCLSKKRTMAMLGLGDIVVPGMMLAFALRFDLYLYYLRLGERTQKSSNTVTETDAQKPIYVNARGSWGERLWTRRQLWSKEVKAKQFPKPYFFATIFGYLVGMCTTVVVMQVAQHAQPALLYLVPGVLLSLWGTALVKGDLKTLWQYSELVEDDKKTTDGGSKSTGDARQTPDSDQSKKADDDTGNGAGQELELVKTPEASSATQKRGKESEESHSRRLVYFSITLPRSSEEGEQVPGSSGNMNGSAGGNDRERGDDGEPPEKRARRA
ncbi:hypothetical protein A1O3_03310 [Capronia epimyces CBS 606.96]|uniref:Minor histocompatibility antigen H13 n=1 Tax=Capronia epimyces CBS 606.96 TaxID=1182542 RepID=W9YVR6_9EURO|nr:uncharacterized protein A1O3_03310 [Capronia epimyces CBS 606.96]EXJ86359.1 hypothetical protein A1O3_03310 [Capronia epimyces CBS 606.96]